MRNKEERKRAREEKVGVDPAISKDKDVSKGRERTFKQREAITRDVREQREKGSFDGTAEGNTNKRFKSSHDDGNSQALQGALAKIF